jgi:hypothetical protein
MTFGRPSAASISPPHILFSLEGGQLHAYLTQLRDGAEKNGDVCQVLAAGQNVSCLA